MNCKKFQKYIYLFKEGELTSSEKRNLEIHLNGCSKCAIEAETVISDFSKLNNLKRELEFKESDILFKNIERAIVPEFNFKTVGIKNYIEKIMERISISKARFAFSTIVVVFMVLLVAQEVSVLTRISMLEKRMLEEKNETLDFSQLKLSKFVSQNQDQILIDRQALENILESYSDLKLTNKILLATLRKAVPELEDNFIDNGLDEQEMKKIMDKKDVFYSLIREL